jgi:katanin p60 ATPase-containing subunit A1
MDNKDNIEDKNRRESEINNNILMRDYIPTENYKVKQNNQIESKNNNIINDKRFERFGGKAPFQLNDKEEDNNSERLNKIKKDNKEQNDNFVVYKKPTSTSADRKEKDPMVWDPPEIKKKPIVSKPSNINNVNKNNIKKPEVKKVEKDDDKRRNYEKPWKLPEEKKVANKQENKSSFLLHCYPDGNGPDSELIEMLEREVVDTNPNVKFEDIADLDKAKNVSKEAVLLPLLMPEYFKVIIFNPRV